MVQRPWRCTQEHSADCPTPNHACRHHQQPQRHAATTTTAIGGRPGHTPLPPSAKDGPGIAQKSATLTLWSDQAATHQRPRCRTTTTTSVTGQHQGYPPMPPPTGPKGPVLCTRARCRPPSTQLHAPQPPMPTMVRNCHHNPGEPTPPTSTTIHRAATPRRRAQAHDVNCARRRTSDAKMVQRRHPMAPRRRCPTA